MNRHTVPNALMAFPGIPINGGSKPRYYDFDDGVVRLVKWHPSKQGPKMCFNELVASRLGQLIEAPILRGTVVFVPDDIIADEHRPEATEGFHFGVAYMDGENFKPTEHYEEIQNSEQLAAAAVLLAWLNVADQHGHNQYFQKTEIRIHGSPPESIRRFRLVDMGFMFGEAAWSAGSLATIPTKYEIPSHLIDNTTLEMVEAAIVRLNAVQEESIRQCFVACPPEWSVSAVDAEAAVARLLASRLKLLNIIKAGNLDLK